MKDTNKLSLIFATLLTFSACGSVDLREQNSQEAAYIQTWASISLGWGSLGGEYVQGKIIKIDGKLAPGVIVPTNKQIAITPGVHEIEMIWFSSKAPTQINENVRRTGDALSGIAYSSNKNFKLKVSFEKDYHYFVNLQPSINNNNLEAPDKLCISRAKLGAKEISKSSIGGIGIKSQLPIIACSSN